MQYKETPGYKLLMQNGYLSKADLADVETDSADSAVSANPTDSFNSTDSYFNPYLDSLGLFLTCGLLLLLCY